MQYKLYILIISILATSCVSYGKAHKHAQPANFVVSIKKQTLCVMHNGICVKKYPVSTSYYGIGDERGSNKTPLGRHRIHAKIGNGAPMGTIFKSTINTKKIATIFHRPVLHEEQIDCITTRIVQIDGLEPRNHTSFDRGIWMHGTPYEGNMGKKSQPSSHGCIRMKNHDIVELYPHIQIGMILDIRAQ